MTTPKNLLAGLGGAITLNILHESLKKLDPDMPRIDKLGEEAMQKGLEAVGTSIESKQTLYGVTLGADVLSNALYFSMIGGGDPEYIWKKAIALGLAAGTGAIALPETMGLHSDPVAKSIKTKSLTVGYYLFGALITACILEATADSKIF